MRRSPRGRPDPHGDGKADDSDTLFAARFTKGNGGPARQAGLDPRLLDVLARCVAQAYPREFVPKLSDDTLEREYQDAFGKPFSPVDCLGIALRVLGNAGHGDDPGELLAGRG